MSVSIDGDAGALAGILETIPEFVLLVDRDGVIRYINRVEPGYDRVRVMGMPADDFLFPDSGQTHHAALESVLATGQEHDYEVQVEAPDGTAIWYRSRMLPYRQSGEVVGVLILGTNITELKLAQEALAKLQRLLPVCSWCERIRNEDGDWETIERYLSRRLDTELTHGMCPECYERESRGGEGAARNPGAHQP